MVPHLGVECKGLSLGWGFWFDRVWGVRTIVVMVG
jgi:hypothetical protein